MKTDLYTKVVLTVVALLLALIACNQYVSPTVSAFAQTPQRVVIVGVDTKNSRLPVDIPSPLAVSGLEGKPVPVLLVGGSQAVPVHVVP